MARQRRWEEDDEEDFHSGDFDFGDDDIRGDEDGSQRTESSDAAELTSPSSSSEDESVGQESSSSTRRRGRSSRKSSSAKRSTSSSGGARKSGGSKSRAASQREPAESELAGSSAEPVPPAEEGYTGGAQEELPAGPGQSVAATGGATGNSSHEETASIPSSPDYGEPQSASPSSVPEEPDCSKLPPDDAQRISALRALGCRVDLDPHGHAWRIFLYERNKDNALALVHGFPCLKELWLFGARVTAPMVDQFRQAHPNVKVYI